MKNTIRTGLMFAALFALFGGAACSTTQSLNASPSVPSSEGTVKTSNGANGNTVVQVIVMRLSSPARIAPDASVYVVWVVPQNGGPQNVGALRVNSNLEGTLDTVTPHRAFRLLVTPEPSATGDKPTHDPVFTADVAARS